MNILWGVILGAVSAICAQALSSWAQYLRDEKAAYNDKKRREFDVRRERLEELHAAVARFSDTVSDHCVNFTSYLEAKAHNEGHPENKRKLVFPEVLHGPSARMSMLVSFYAPKLQGDLRMLQVVFLDYMKACKSADAAEQDMGHNVLELALSVNRSTLEFRSSIERLFNLSCDLHFSTPDPLPGFFKQAVQRLRGK